MTPFYTRFGELAARETRCIHQILPGRSLPVGQYGFVEFYCEEDNCDCRRVLIQVTTPQSPQTALASINYGWESAEFYTRWMHGDEQAGRDIAGAMLDPLQPQSHYADHLLDVFQTIVRTDPAYVARLARHYELFKRAPGYQPCQPATGPLPTPLKPYLAAPKIGRNDPCPCGSGRKYKQCCGMP